MATMLGLGTEDSSFAIEAFLMASLRPVFTLAIFAATSAAISNGRVNY